VVRYLIARPIAIGMILFAFMAGGIVSFLNLPTSLMPDIDIPIIKIQLHTQGLEPEYIENQIAAPLRNALRQVSGLSHISGKISSSGLEMSLKFEYGTPIDLAYIETNEKIDANIHVLPKGISRPNVVKTSITDIPVMFLNIAFQANLEETEKDHVSLSEFVSTLVKRRIEQLPQISIADISGMVFNELRFVPKKNIIESLGIDEQYLISILETKQFFVQSLQLTEGNYTYSVKLQGGIQSYTELLNLPLLIGGRVFRINELADVQYYTPDDKGEVYSGKSRQIAMALIMREDARAEELKSEMDKLIEQMRIDYPNITFTTYNDQTRLLNYAIDNIWSTFIIGTLLASMLSLIFSYNRATAVLIGLSVPLGIVINFVFFYIFDISINLLSVAGLVFGIGLMIDNAIIVTDNIAQKLKSGMSKKDACVAGTNEIIVPMLSSMLTTVVVFIPLVVYPGAGGTLFYFQAVAVATALFSSFVLSIAVIPVFANLLYSSKTESSNSIPHKLQAKLVHSYERTLKLCFRKPIIPIVSVFVLFILGGYAYINLKISDFPELKYPDFSVTIHWNENINQSTNNARTKNIVNHVNSSIEFETRFTGAQQFLISHMAAAGRSDGCVIYLKAENPVVADTLWQKIHEFVSIHYPDAQISKQSAGNSFEAVFTNQGGTTIELGQIPNRTLPTPNELDEYKNQLQTQLVTKLNVKNTRSIAFKLKLLPEKLRLYGVNEEDIYSQIRKHTRNYEIMSIKTTLQSVPVIFGNDSLTLTNLKRINIETPGAGKVPLYILADLVSFEKFNELYFNENGLYFPIEVGETHLNPDEFVKNAKNVPMSDFILNFNGSFFVGKQNLMDMSKVLLFSVLLLFLILAAQFESIMLPIIILIELPIDILGALLFLKLFNADLNIMALIGMIIMAGIVINDSILKIDAIRNFEKSGKGLLYSIILGGRNRLMSIVLTTSTTILAVLPFLFSEGMGNELQMPMTLVLVGGLLVGTPVSLFIIPLIYYWIQKSGKKINK